MAKVAESPEVWKEATLMYDGMTGVLTSDKPMVNVELHDISEGVCGYTFNLPLTEEGVSLLWTMDDDRQVAVNAVQEVKDNIQEIKEAKTNFINDRLNYKIPYFRCSDDDIVKVYYYLWSIFLSYYKGPGKGMRALPTTQTAVKNFLGLHRFDAVFQILVGSWIDPQYHDFYANGNVLTWADTLPYRADGNKLPDNFGIDWVSGVYGASTIAHVQGAWQIYEHSGNLTFLQKSYEFYKELYWDGIGDHFFYAYDSGKITLDIFQALVLLMFPIASSLPQ